MEQTRWIGALALGLTMVAGGCSAMGMDRGPLSPMSAEQEVQIDDAAIAEALARQPQLPDRVRIGVWFRGPSDGRWRWDFEDRERAVDVGEGLARIELFPISGGFVEGNDLHALRLAAARHGAHAILVVDGHAEQETADNAWLATYPLLLPILFAPAQELDTRFGVEAALYDVRNGFLYLTVEAEGLEEQQRAHVWIDRDAGIREARERAMGHFARELGERLAHLVGEPEDGSVALRAPDTVAGPGSGSETVSVSETGPEAETDPVAAP